MVSSSVVAAITTLYKLASFLGYFVVSTNSAVISNVIIV